MPTVPPDGAGAVVPPDGAGAVVCAWASASEAVSTSAGNAKPNAAASPRRENASRREIICDLIFSLISQSPYFDPPQLQSEACVHERALNRSGSAVARNASAASRASAKLPAKMKRTGSRRTWRSCRSCSQTPSRRSGPRRAYFLARSLLCQAEISLSPDRSGQDRNRGSCA
jgi:hypothetical protein